MKRQEREAGSVMVAMVFVGISLAGMVFSMISLSNVTKDEYENRAFRAQALYVAEAGVARAIIDIRSGGEGNVGIDAPLPYGPGLYRATSVDNGDTTWTITSTGIVQGRRRTIRADVHELQGVYYHAMFAGNSSGDPTYVLELGGTGTQADQVVGDIYSGNDVALLDGSTVDGDIRANGVIDGAGGFDGVSQPPLDIAAMAYEAKHDVDVAQEFRDHGAPKSNDHGGTALEVPEEYGSHIFRMNPDDRNSECVQTKKDDFFLEDPAHPPSTDNVHTRQASCASVVSLPKDGTDDGKRQIIYYIDGNLWIHSRPSFSTTLTADGEEVLVTFVVKGNLYVCDNLLLTDPEKDGIAFIVVKDEEVEDSGNIVFGDKAYGILDMVEAFMFAENDFMDRNLPASATDEIVVSGLMAAGNQIAIDRAGNGAWTKLILDDDSRLRKGLLDLPGIPTPVEEDPRVPFTLISMIEVSSN
ncbi:MAG: hypothetical protein ABFS86_09750 [Planctomycetota bacterium]